MIKNYSLFFIRHAKLLLPYKDHSEMPFELLADLASLKLNPPIDTQFISEQMPSLASAVPLEAIENIHTSPVRRCLDTARFIRGFIFEIHKKEIGVIPAKELQELRLDLRKTYSPQDKRVDIGSLNTAVFQAMTSGNKNCESAESAYKRIDSFMRGIIKDESILCVSHDFIMRVIEIYIKNRGEPRDQVTYNELVNTQRNSYLHGFATDASLSNFFPF